MARLEELLTGIPDLTLRKEIADEVANIKSRTKFGLVFEQHIPEMAVLLTFPVRQGAFVRVRTEPNNRSIYRVTAISSSVATIDDRDTTECREIPIDQLHVVKDFSDPIYPALMPVETVEQGGDKPHHVVINGENFHALEMLVFMYTQSVDLIYIDPPYNTGARDWKYNNDFIDTNDQWRHSKWLSFMDKRLRLAKRLLKSDGILVVTIDENEHAHLGMLLESLFPNHAINSIAIVHNPRGVQGDNFSYSNEFAVFVIPAGLKAITRRRADKKPDNLRNWGGESERTDAKNCFYPIYIEDDRVVEFGAVADDDYHPAKANVAVGKNRFEIWPIDNKGVERKWRYARDSVEDIKDQLIVRGSKGTYQILLKKESEPYKTVWQDPKYDAGTHGTRLIGKLIDAKFPFPKSLYAVEEVLYACTARKKDALILDFFAGSGTTLHATCLLNAEDGGSRQCIIVTNNEVEETVARQCHKTGLFPGDPEYERLGIFEQVTLPRIKAAITGVRPNGKPAPDAYQGDLARPISLGFEENVDFFRLGYLDPDRVEIGVEFASLLPMLWLMSGGIGHFEGIEHGSWVIPADSTYAVLVHRQRDYDG
ncbi:MAG: site-specific DNA-methyltransferase [Bryobacteraceae bacterium]